MPAQKTDWHNERHDQGRRTGRRRPPRRRDRRRGAGSRGGKIEANFHLDRVADRQRPGGVLRLIAALPRHGAARLFSPNYAC
jgi:hypothetical protein